MIQGMTAFVSQLQKQERMLEGYDKDNKEEVKSPCCCLIM